MGLVTIATDLDTTQTWDVLASNAYMTILKDDPALNWVTQGPPEGMDEKQQWIWTDEVRIEVTGTLNANIAGSAVTLTLVSTADFKDGDQITVDEHIDSDFIQVVWRVDLVFSATVLNVTQIRGSDQTLTSTGQAIHRTAAIEDNRKPTSTEQFGQLLEPTRRDNVFQIFEQNVELGFIARNTGNNQGIWGVSGNDAAMTRAMEQAAHKMKYELYHAIFNGVKNPATGAQPKGYMEGFITSINTTSNPARVNAGGNPLTSTDVNDAVTNLANEGLPKGTPLIMLMSTTNARVLSALKNTQIAYPNNEPNGVLGGSVQTFQIDLPEWPGVTIVVDRDMPDDMVPVIATPWVRLTLPLNTPIASIEDASVPGQFGTRSIMRSMVSLRVDGRNNFHTMIVNITP